MKKLIFLALLVSNSLIGFAQSAIEPAVWSNIEAAIRAKKNLAACFARVRELKAQAMAGKDYYSLARAFYYQLQIKDLRTEDTLYFHNSAFIDSILFSPATPAILAKLMHVMQAQRLMHFSYRSNQYKRYLYETPQYPYNYAAMTKEQLDTVIQHHFNAAKAIPLSTEADAVDVTWLSSDPLAFLFKPGVQDIIFFEQIYYTSASKDNVDIYPVAATYVLGLKPDDFITLMDTVLADRKENDVFRLYTQWLRWRQKDTGAYYFIETLARKYIYSSFSRDKEIGTLYESYLRERAAASFEEVRAHAVYQLCLLLHERYGDHNGESYSDRYSDWSWERKIDTSDSLAGVKALQLYDANRALFKRFSFLADILDRMRARILSRQLECTTEDNALPGNPLLAKLRYKNVAQIHYKLVPLSAGDMIPNKREAALALLFSRPIVRESVENLPLPADYNQHRSFLKIDPLPPGRYALLFSSNQVTSGDSTVNYFVLQVTAVAGVRAGHRLYALDRNTGMPIAGAMAVGYYDSYTGRGTTFKKIRVPVRYVFNTQGELDLPLKEDYHLQISNNNDTISLAADNEDDRISDDVFDADRFDTKLEFYEDRATVGVYTDRAIYRPGQKVYYKALLLTRNAATGAAMVMNEKNMKEGFFRNNLAQWIRNKKPVLYITDPFNRKVDSIRLIPNAWGSVSGEYTLPVNAATGGWEFTAGGIDIHYPDRGGFHVEEYKRPTYELKVDKPAQTYKPGESITFVVHTHSFSGVSLANTKIHYSVTRSGGAKTLGELFKKSDLADSIGLTDQAGRLEITIADTALQKTILPDSLVWNFRYSLHAQSVDATGESQEADQNLNVSTRPVNIDLRLGTTYKLDELRPIVVTTRDINGLTIGKKLHVTLYKITSHPSANTTSESYFTDQWLYPVDQLQQWFPDRAFGRDTASITETKVYETTINTGDFEKLRLPPENFSPGTYRVIMTCEEEGKLLGETERKFTLFNTQSSEIPDGEDDFYHLADNYLSPGDTLRFFSGTRFDSSFTLLQLKYYSLGKNKLQVVSWCRAQKRTAGIKEWDWKIPEDASSEVELSEFCIWHNAVYAHTDRVTLSSYRKNPQIIIQQFRSQLAPAANTTFSVTVKARDIHIASELMSTMYDASLDKLKRHDWSPPRIDPPDRLDPDFPNGLKQPVKAEAFFPSAANSDIENRSPIWWARGIPGAGVVVRIQGQNSINGDGMEPLRMLEGRVPGLVICQANGLAEAVIGYGTTTERLSVGSVSHVTSSTISFQALANLIGKDRPLIILDGKPFTGDLASLKLSEITQAMLLRDADATAIYGSKAAQGVLLISTKGDVVFPGQRQEPIVRVRKDFNETAFFFPAVYADRDGYYRFTFTMPESITTWYWKLLAHTKMAQFAYAERKISTVLPLMVQPNLPRVLCQGDKLVLQTRISNLDTTTLSGNAVCTIEDAVTGEDLTAAMVTTAAIGFNVNSNSNTSVAFHLQVPAGLLHPLKVTISAKTADMGDAEEHIIPVLSSAVLVKKAVSFRMLSADSIVAFPILPAGAKPYGLGLSITPPPQTALLYSLPSLANYSYDCAEQLSNKLLARFMAIKLMRTNTQLQASFRQAATAPQDKTEAPESLPGDLAEQSMPWLSLAHNGTQQQKALTSLLDTVKNKVLIESYLDKLYDLQENDGGLPWFGGAESNIGMSAYVLARAAQLAAEGWGPENQRSSQHYNQFIRHLILYCDSCFAKKAPGNLANSYALNYFYARSYWRTPVPLRDTLLAKIKATIIHNWQNIDAWSLGSQTLLINATMHYFPAGDSLRQKALAQLSSIREAAIIDDVNGVRWKGIADADDLDNTAEETLAILSETFSLASPSDSLPAGMLQWLLASKNEHQWTTTRGTAAAIDLLSKNPTGVSGNTLTLNATVNGKPIAVTDDLLKGNSFSFEQTSDAAPLRISKPGTTAVSGHIVYYYFMSPDALPDANKEISLDKQLLRYNASKGIWVPIDEQAALKIGDTIKVILTITTKKALRYVAIDDKRAAAFEPAENTSEYDYQGGYYRSVRDEGAVFFADVIPSGRTEIDYKIIVAHEGSFTEGPASLTCVYKPFLSAYSRAATIKTIR